MLQALGQLAGRIAVAPTPDYPTARPRTVGRYLYLPVEVAARELRAKAWLAGEMARRGFQVVLGAAWNISVNQFRDLPPGIVLFKTLNALDAANIHLAQQANHLAVALNEEFFGLLPEPWIYRVEAHPKSLELVDLICAQSDRSAAVLRELAGDKVAVTGNPRVMCDKGDRHGDILVCTMAGTVNGLLPFVETIKMIVAVFGRSLEGDVLRLVQEQIDHEWDSLGLVMETTLALSRSFPERSIRLRIHPVENRAAYNAGGNIKLDDQRPFLESVKDAAVVVYVSGCGTGLESFLADVPAVRLGRGGHGISAHLHLGAATANEAVDAVRRQLEQPQMIGSLEGFFAPVTLPAELARFQKAHASQKAVDVETLWQRRQKQVLSQPFLANKFPDTPANDIARLTGCSVKTLGWNTWLVRA